MMRGVRNTLVAAFAAAGALLVAPGLAQAAQGFVVEETSLRAGPDEEFPPVDAVPAGAEVDVHGCLDGLSWCDVSFQADRGWVLGEVLEIIDQGARVKITAVSVEVAPVVAFEVATYWERHYHSKPFFAERDRFAKIEINIRDEKAKAGAKAKTRVDIDEEKRARSTESPDADAKAKARADVKTRDEGTGGSEEASRADEEQGATARGKEQPADEQPQREGRAAKPRADADTRMGTDTESQTGAKDCPPGQRNCPPAARSAERAQPQNQEIDPGTTGSTMPETGGDEGAAAPTPETGGDEGATPMEPQVPQQ